MKSRLNFINFLVALLCLGMLGTVFADEELKDILVGVNYFSGWWEGPGNKWLDPNGNSWLPNYPGREPLLGQYNTQTTMDNEIIAAARDGVDFFQILWYCMDTNHPPEPGAENLNNGLTQFCNSPESGRMKFTIEYSNHPPFIADTNEKWVGCINTWVAAMQHPSYLRVGGKLVFKMLSWYNFYSEDCHGNLLLCQHRLDLFRQAVRDANLGEMLIGCGVGEGESITADHPAAGLFDFTGSYMGVPPIPQAPQPYPYDDLADYIYNSRQAHKDDVIKYVPFLAAGWDPRPWNDPRPSFEFPTLLQWVARLQEIADDMRLDDTFGLPLADGSRQKVFTTYCWNEYGEGGIVSPTVGEGYMKLEGIREVFGGYYIGDLNQDGIVNFQDFALFVLRWLDTDCGVCGGADLTGDGDVDFYDFNNLGNNWSAGTGGLLIR